MKLTSVQGMIAGMLFTLPCWSADITHTVRPGVGIFEDTLGSNSYLSVEETTDGYSFEMFLDETADSENSPSVPSFVDQWESAGWTRVHFDKVEWGEGSPYFTFKFNPFDEADGGVSFITGTTVYLPPSTPRVRPYAFVATTCQNVCGPGMVSIEYSVTMFPTPLPGDFNFDDRVNLDDFMILADNFGDITSGLSWKDGDANLDRGIGFDDFLILSAGFGAVREPEVASIPEPSTRGMMILALFATGAFRRIRSLQRTEQCEISKSTRIVCRRAYPYAE